MLCKYPAVHALCTTQPAREGYCYRPLVRPCLEGRHIRLHLSVHRVAQRGRGHVVVLRWWQGRQSSRSVCEQLPSTALQATLACTPQRRPNDPAHLRQRAQVLLGGAVVLPRLQPVCHRKVPGVVVQHNDGGGARQARQLAQQLLKAAARGVGERRLGRLVEAGRQGKGSAAERFGKITSSVP